jgi:hypothetical protein
MVHILGLIITVFNRPAQPVACRQLHSGMLHGEIFEMRKGLLYPSCKAGIEGVSCLKT